MNKTEIIRSILIQHQQHYPYMQILDHFKLIYQNEFAGGHLITNEAECLKRLQDEVQALNEHTSVLAENRLQRFESISNGLCRLNLNQIKDTGIDLATVNRFFIKAAETVVGNSQGFKDKLSILRECIQDKSLPYDLADFDAIIDAYDFLHYPPVSHSTSYRQAYFPAYRIVQSAICEYFEVFCRIDSLLRARQPINVAIDGYCGSGKSTLASLLERIYACNVIKMDHFFLPPDLRTPERLREPGGNIDYDRYNLEVATGLRAGRAFTYRAFDCKVMRLGQTMSIPPNRLNVIEGSYSMHPKFGDLYDLKIFILINRNEQIRRILQRSGPDLLQRFIQEWIPMENRYFNELTIIEQSDLMIQQPSVEPSE